MANAADPARKELAEAVSQMQAVLLKIRADVVVLRRDLQALVDTLRRREEARALSADQEDGDDDMEASDGDSVITEVDPDE